MGITVMVKKKVKLSKVNKKIKRLVKIHGSVKLEVYRNGRRGEGYGVRYLKENGDCYIHYCNTNNGRTTMKYNNRNKQTCCFFDEYSIYSNEDGDRVTIKSLDDTLRAMQQHDGRHYKVKYIYAGGRKITVK